MLLNFKIFSSHKHRLWFSKETVDIECQMDQFCLAELTLKHEYLWNIEKCKGCHLDPWFKLQFTPRLLELRTESEHLDVVYVAGN